jgi:hypothetical protein
MNPPDERGQVVRKEVSVYSFWVIRYKGSPAESAREGGVL